MILLKKHFKRELLIKPSSWIKNFFFLLASKVIKNNARIMKKMFIVVSRSLMDETVRGSGISIQQLIHSKYFYIN